MSAVLEPGRPPTLFIFSSNSVPEPWSGVVWLSELAIMRRVLILAVPVTFPLTIQSLAVSPAGWTGSAWKVTSDESKTRSPRNPIRSSAPSIVKVRTGKVNVRVRGWMADIGRATMIGSGVGIGAGFAVLRVTVAVVIPEGKVTVPS